MLTALFLMHELTDDHYFVYCKDNVLGILIGILSGMKFYMNL